MIIDFPSPFPFPFPTFPLWPKQVTKLLLCRRFSVKEFYKSQRSCYDVFVYVG